MAKTDENAQRLLDIREREVVVREKEVNAKLRELQIRDAERSNVPAIYVEPSGQGGQPGNRRQVEPILVLLIRIARNLAYGIAGITLAATLGAMFSPDPNQELVGLGFSSSFALGFLGLIFHIALWNEGDRS